MTKTRIFFIISFLLIVISCKKDIPPEVENPIIIYNAEGVYITNEGNFQFGNSSISYYEHGFTDATYDLFEPANNRPLGDICQSLYFFNNKAYLIINNSHKIEVVDEDTFESIATISGFNSPRYFLPVSNAKAYVTDLYDDAISIVDLNNNSRIGEIPCNGWTEELVMLYGKVFVTNRESNYLYIINPQTDAISDSIEIGYGANSLREDKYGKLWVLCSGNESNHIAASLNKIDPLNSSLEKTYYFSNLEDTPFKLEINASNDTLYYLNNGIYQMAISSDNLPNNPIISENNRNFYSIGVHPKTKEIFVADAIDYVQRGRVYIYKPDGEQIGSFLAGIIPGNFYFK